MDEAPYAHLVAAHRTTDPQRGFGWAPKRDCAVREVEIGRFYKLTSDGIQPTKIIVPRVRKEFFQDDVLGDTLPDKPTTQLSAWLSGGSSTPTLVSRCPSDMTKLSDAPKIERKKPKYVLKSLEDEEEADPTEAVFRKMQKLTGKASREDAAAMLVEGVDEDEWDDDEDVDAGWSPGLV